MKRDTASWPELLRRLVADSIELLVAEADQIGRDLRPNLSRLRRSALAFFVALFVAFWFLGLLIAAAVLGLAAWLPAWGAALVVAALLAAVIVVLAALGRRWVKGIDNPVRVAGDRMRDHLDWWSENASAVLHAEAVEPSGQEQDR